MNESLPSLYPVRRRQRPQQKARSVPHEVLQPNITISFNECETSIQYIRNQNIPSNRYLDEETSSTIERNQEEILIVTEVQEPVDMNKHFPCLRLLNSTQSKDLQLKTHMDVPNQKIIDKIVDQLNTKTMHFYNLPFVKHFLNSICFVQRK